MKKILYVLGLVLALASCSDDNDDWLQPQKNLPGEEDLVLTVGEVPAIELANVESETVQLFAPTVNAPEGSNVSYNVVLYSEDRVYTSELKADAQGYVNVAELKEAVTALCGKRPVARTIPFEVNYVTIDGQAMKTSVEGSITVTLDPAEVPVIEEVYYLTGTMNGWDNNNTDFALTNGGGDVYDNSVFTCEVPATADGSAIEFKVTPASGVGGDWSKCLTASDTEGKFATDNAGGNFQIPADPDAVSYIVTFDMLDGTYSFTAQKRGQFIYFIGATDGWNNDEPNRQRLESPNFDNVYTGFIYMADPNGWGNEFKFQKEKGDWSTEVNSGQMTSISGDIADGGGNFKANAGEGVYFVKLDLSNNTIEATRINNMNLVGDFNGWNAADDAQQMTWNATDYCYEITGATVTSNGWKFTANNDWKINLGGAHEDLVADGSNLWFVGTTIKLYPTRRTNDKIFCTVE